MKNIYSFEIWKWFPLARGKDFRKKSHLVFGLILFCFGLIPLNSFSQSILINEESCTTRADETTPLANAINGLTAFAGTVQIDEINPTTIAGKDIVIVNLPYQAIPVATITALDNFVQGGGRLIVIGCPCCGRTSVPIVNPLLSSLGVPISIENTILAGTNSFCSPLTFSLEDTHPLTAGITTLAGGCLGEVNNLGGASPIFFASSGEVLGASFDKGQGEVLVFGDVNYFITCPNLPTDLQLLENIITIDLNTPPTAVCKAATTMPSFPLDATCNVTITTDDINDGSFDAETLEEDLFLTLSTTPMTVTGTSALTFTSPGPKDVYLIVKDEDDERSECMTTIMVVDNMPPTITCKDYTVSLVNGAATIVTGDLYIDASDNCGGTSVSLSKYAFSCIDVGENIVEVTVTDDAGQTAKCNATVTVVNNSAPAIKCNEAPIVVVLDEDGNGEITEEQALISIGVTCGDVKVTLERTAFTCDDAGKDLTLAVTVEDLTNGSVSECTFLVKVRDNEDPVIECKDPITVLLSHVDEDEQIKLLPENLIASSSDNCGIDWEKSTVSIPFVDCSHAETTVSVTVTIVDFAGNEAYCPVDIYVDDNESPELSCNDPHPHRDFPLNEEGILNISLEDLENYDVEPLYIFEDNCAMAPSSVTIAPVHFTCEHIGEQTITLTAYDGNGNDATCDITINVVDEENPTVNCLLGTYVEGEVDERIIRELTDEVSQIVITYEDLIFADPDHPDNLVTDFINDNCEVETIKIALVPSPGEEPEYVDELLFDCEDIGENGVIITVWDAAGNFRICTSRITIIDAADPTIHCVAPFDLPLVLDDMGNFSASINAEDMVRDVGDNCGVESIKINGEDEWRFDCEDIVFNVDGLPVPIELEVIVTDFQGNTASCPIYVTPIDNVKPTLVCPEGVMSVDLDEMGDGTITIDMVKDFINDGGSYDDECGNLTFEVSQEEYDCGNVGGHSVTFTVIDKSGNKASCDIDIWVQDNTAPVVACQPNDNFHPMLFTLNNGYLKLEVEDILKSAEDNCGVSGLSISPSEFDCSDIGVMQEVTVTAFDVEGNTGSCSALILIGSSVEPKANCRDVELLLNSDGEAELTINMVNDGSEGDCETKLSFAEDKNNLVETLSFDCNDIFDEDGNAIIHEVTLYVTDKAGTQVSCTANVTVKDVTAPIANCRLIPLDLRLVNGTAYVPANNISTSSSDGCGGPVKLSVEPSQFDCSHVGIPQTVVLTVEDESGNTSTCEATVNVINDQAPDLECKSGILPIALNEMGMVELTVEDLLAENSVPCATGVVYEIVVADRAEPKFTCDDIKFEDLENPFLFNVTLKATANGQTVECMTQVEIIDDLDPVLDCSDEVVMLELDDWGKVKLSAENLPFDATDNCGIKDTIISPEILFCEATMEGEIEVTITVRDSAGNEAICIRKVVVKDITRPTIACPVFEDEDGNEIGIIELEPTEDCKANFSWTIPVPEDACGIKDLFVAFASNNDPNTPQDVVISEDGLTASYDFPTGTTVVTYRTVDNNGNDEICVFRVQVTDTHAPDFVNCPIGAVTVSTDPGVCYKDISLADDLKIGVSDNCDLVSYTCKYTFPDLSEEEVDALTEGGNHSAFPKGRTEVLLTAIDAYGNTSTCEFVVFVSDDEDPTISFNDSYPALQGLTDGAEIEVPLEDVDLLGVWNATASDNCPGVMLESFVEEELSGNTCATDGYSRTLLCTWTAIDEKGNTTSLSITVKILCPAPSSDLSITKIVKGLTFSVDETKTLILNVEEDLDETDGLVEIVFPKTGEFEFVFDPVANSVANPLYNPAIPVLGGPTLPINNADWELVDNGSDYSLFSKPGVRFVRGQKSSIALEIIAKIEGAKTNYQAEFYEGGGEKSSNDAVNFFFIIQRND